MLRDRSLRAGRSRAWQADPNPMDGVANLADIMLVFACGLMVSILLRWDLDLSKVSDVVSRDELIEVGDFQQAIDSGALSGALDSKGAAYEDPETGTVYIILP